MPEICLATKACGLSLPEAKLRRGIYSTRCGTRGHVMFCYECVWHGGARPVEEQAKKLQMDVVMERAEACLSPPVKLDKADACVSSPSKLEKADACVYSPSKLEKVDAGVGVVPGSGATPTPAVPPTPAPPAVSSDIVMLPLTSSLVVKDSGGDDRLVFIPFTQHDYTFGSTNQFSSTCTMVSLLMLEYCSMALFTS